MTCLPRSHYAELAPRYDGLPHHRPALLRAVGSAIVRALRLQKRDLVVDLCAGTGLFSREVVRRAPLAYQILAVDGSPEMLAGLRSRSERGIRPVTMDAQLFSAYPMRCDKVFVKDALAHLPDPAALFADLRARLAEEGRLVVVEMAPDSQTPLFKEALRRWEAVQPRPEAIRSMLEGAGFRVESGCVEVRQVLPRADYLHMVEARYVPVLATFDDGELWEGLGEIRERHGAADGIELTHRFDLVTASGPSYS